MVLAHLVLTSKMNFGVAHVNYHLRGEESDKDAELVKSWCKKHNIAFHLKEVDPAEYKSGKSIQMIARDIRYDYYNEMVERGAYSKILTAHNANDNVETVLFNLAKGTGISGLTGIAPQKGKVIRPLLFATKREIYTYAESENITWREDKSNAKNDYSRNLIRNKVVPLLKKINPSLEETFQESLIRIQGAGELVNEEKRKVLDNFFLKREGTSELKLKWIKNDNKSLLLLYEIIKGYGFNFQDAKDLFEAILNRRSGKYFYAEGFEINLDREGLLIQSKGGNLTVDLEVLKGTAQVRTSFCSIYFETIHETPANFGSDNTVYLDADLIKYPLRIRTWREGDYFYPLGMKGKKKVSDFMIDSKIPVSLKRRVLVIESEGQILWVIGYRIDDRFKLTSKTKGILKIHVNYA